MRVSEGSGRSSAKVVTKSSPKPAPKPVSKPAPVTKQQSAPAPKPTPVVVQKPATAPSNKANQDLHKSTPVATTTTKKTATTSTSTPKPAPVVVSKPASAPSNRANQDLHKSTQSASSSTNKPVASSTSVSRPVAAQSYQSNQDLYKNSKPSSSTATSTRPASAQSNKAQQELHQSTQVASSTKKPTTTAKPAAIQSYKVNQDLYKTGQTSAPSNRPANTSSSVAQSTLHKSSKDGDSLSLSFVANQANSKSTTEDKQLKEIYAALAKQPYVNYQNNDTLVLSNGEYASTFEGKRKVLGGNGSGTPDGLAPFGIAGYDFFLSDIVTMIDTESTRKEKIEAAAYTFIKPAKALDTGYDLVKVVKNTKDVAAKEKKVVENVATKGTGKAATKQAIKQNEVTTYKDFVDRSVVGDSLEGHEVWQHANLKANGLATNRLSTEASKNNPVIALEREQHKLINKAQRGVDATNQLPLDNITSNSKILRDAGISEDIVNDITNKALNHMKNTLE